MGMNTELSKDKDNQGRLLGCLLHNGVILDAGSLALSLIAEGNDYTNPFSPESLLDDVLTSISEADNVALLERVFQLANQRRLLKGCSRKAMVKVMQCFVQ